MRLVPLDRAGMSRWLDDLVRLDGRLFQTMGAAYAEAGWTAEQFRRDLDGKWALSLAAVDGARALAGFCVASAPRAGAVHIHRLAVEPRGRHAQGLADAAPGIGQQQAEKAGFNGRVLRCSDEPPPLRSAEIFACALGVEQAGQRVGVSPDHAAPVWAIS